MPQFKNTADLMAYLKKAVDESLTNDVFPVIREYYFFLAFHALSVE